MAGDKITISMDDVNSATPVPGPAVAPVFTPGYVPPESDHDSMPNRTGLFVGIGIAAVALCCIIGIGIKAFIWDEGPSEGNGGSPIIVKKERTVDDYKAEIIQSVNEDLAKADSKLKKRIEDAHLTVTVKSTCIVRCDVTTFDGSDKAGKDDDNIDKVSVLVRFNWEGQFLGSGYTDLLIAYDVHNDRLLKSEIDHTTAIINVEDPNFWWDVGVSLGILFS